MTRTKDIKIEKNSAPELVCEKMEEFIFEGIWKVNEKVPPEAELAEMFGVNRFTVRMALQKLNTLGILETYMGTEHMFALLILKSICRISIIST